MNSNEKIQLLSINNKPMIIEQTDITIVHNDTTSACYCIRMVVLLIILIVFIIGIVLIIKKSN